MVASVPPTEVSPTQACQVAPPSTEISSCAERAAAGFVHCDRSILRLHTVTASGTAIGPKLRVPKDRLTFRSMSTEIGAAIADAHQKIRMQARLINRIANRSREWSDG